MDSVKQIYLLLDSTAEGIYAITLDGTGTLVNNAAMKMLGIESKEDFLKKNSPQFDPPHQLQRRSYFIQGLLHSQGHE